MMSSLTAVERIRGCAVGAAVGDALGMPLEFEVKRDPDDFVTEMVDGRIPAGTFTDDMEMALALAESLLAHTPLDPDDLAQRFGAWLDASPSDVGIHTQQVLSRINAGEPWDEAVEAVQARKPDSAGNGSVMRCWPVALAHWDDLDSLLVDSWQQSRVTHPHPDCLTAGTYVNVMIYHLLQGMPLEAAFITTSTLVRTSKPFWNVIYKAPYRAREDLMNTGWVRHTMETAVWAVLNFHSFEEALVQTVNLGSDADTAGTVVGALAGAAYGIDAIPVRWRDALRGEWPLGSNTIWHTDDLIALADDLSGQSA